MKTECGSTKRSPAAWCRTFILLVRRTVSPKIGVGKRSAWTISVGRRGMMRTSAARRSIANIGVVFGQSTQLLYPGPTSAGPTSARSHNYMHETTQGLYDVLLQGRFAFDFVHEDRLEPERLAKYRALLLPNVAILSDRQCQQLREYVHSGGSLMASFETSLYDEDLKPRADFGLADLMGVSKAKDAIGTNGNAYSARIETSKTGRTHAIVEGFTKTNWIAGAQNRVPLKPIDDPALTVVPGFVRYPPELAYPAHPHTQEPAVALRESGAKPNGLVSRGHRAHLLAYRAWRSSAVVGQCNSLGKP